ncbi:hypothetical protein BGW36DRAFT_465274 [Talaromyces proteolyticus]|uniref:Uncharacterized protein n=1 Tax=Talaromyces proteolyticus TaxID=1131652 RepID=A0AAD4KJ91_9EURO|nr:uncharacterized protein BGW36DRAFT_465274 [Talaromyces proteolyticus]KAH8691548.1 hypothetical protein BGW36DRAFT_465274 [Talaromyces proteolyticus]
MEPVADVVTQLVLTALSAGGDPLGSILKLFTHVTISTIRFYLDHRACKHFLEDIKDLFVRLTQQVYIEPLIPSAPADPQTAKIGWIMTAKGTEELFFSVYTDVSRARRHFNLTTARLETMGVMKPLVVNLNSKSKGESIRSRLGATWPAQWRQAMLQRGNPLQGLPMYDKRDISRFALGMVRNAARSPAHRDLLLARVLGLAQFCGIGEVSLPDLMELMVHSCYYEKVARRYIAAALGVHHTVFAGFALECGLPESRVGSLQNPMENFAEVAASFENELVPIGVIERRKAKITRSNELVHVQFKIDSSTAVVEGETIYMISGWAEALLHRPHDHPSKRSLTKDMTVGLVKDIGKEFLPPPLRLKAGNLTRRISRRDIHGNPIYFSSDLESVRVSIKRIAGNKLAAKVAQFGDFKPPPFGGQGVFGVQCGCKTADKNKILPGAAFKGYKRENIFKFRAGPPLRIGYDVILYHWTAGDLPMILFWAESLIKGTYIQVAGECMYCATSRALGSGCNLIIAGGW